MFDIGWTELLVIACVAIIVVGPKDLPRMLRTLGQTIGKLRRMSREFQSTFNEALREAEQQAGIADMKKQVETAANFDPLGDIKKSIEEDSAKRAEKPETGETKSPEEPAETAKSEEPAVPEKPAVAEANPDDSKKETESRPVTEDVKA